MRVIKNIESVSIGKNIGRNDDEIYIGENFAAVVDGVSNKSLIIMDGKKIRIADIIIDAIKRLDRQSAPEYAKRFNLEEFTRSINIFIRRYCKEHNISLKQHTLEATAAIYSKFHNQIWLVGDCRAVYDGQVLEHELKADELYQEMRLYVIRTLLHNGYTKEEIFENDISKEIIIHPEKCEEYITNDNEVQKIKRFLQRKMRQALLDAGFKKSEIREKNLLSVYSYPQKLQMYAKNNPNAKAYGYAVFNGIHTAVENCLIQQLPENVRKIRLATDGFPMSILLNAVDMKDAVERNRALAKKDPISIKKNAGIHNSVERKDGQFVFDDESAIDIRIDYIREKEEDDGRL